MNQTIQSCGSCAWYEETNTLCSGYGQCIWLHAHPGMAQEVPYWMLPYSTPDVGATDGADCHQYLRYLPQQQQQEDLTL